MMLEELAEKVYDTLRVVQEAIETMQGGGVKFRLVEETE